MGGGREAAQNNGVGGFAAGAEHDAALADAGRPVHGHAACGGHEIAEPIAQDAAVTHAHEAFGIDCFYHALFDEVGYQAHGFVGLHCNLS